MFNKLEYSLFMFIFVLSVPISYAWDPGYEKPFIFVDSVNEIPQSRSLRKAYFLVLLDYQKSLVAGFRAYLDLLYGDMLSPGYSERDAITEAIKDDFFWQTEIIQYAGMNMIIFDYFSKGELYDYSRMIERSAETFYQLFR
jgi:hypothetical protein